MVFIDNWKSGWGVISAAHWGQLGLPHTQPATFWGAAGSTSGEGACGSPHSHPLFVRETKEEEPHQCLQGGHLVLAPSLQKFGALCSLLYPSLFTDPASWCFSRWICCSQFPGRAGGARMDECHYGEQTKPGILLPHGENQKERKAGFAECLKHK